MLFWPQAGWWAVRHKVTSILSGAERGTGLDHEEGDFSRGGAGDHRAGLVALSSLFLGISVLLRGLSGCHRARLPTAKRSGLFWGSGVPFSSK